MKQGDLVFFFSQGRWYENVIVKATHGPYVHVAIGIGTNYVLAANPHGIAYSVIPIDAVHSPSLYYTVFSLGQLATPSGIAQGLQWAQAQVGKEYGWLDIAYQALKFLAPNNPFRFGVAGHYDCSDFVTRYLQHAGVSLPDAYADPYANSPNDLARCFGVINAQGKVHVE